MNKTTVILNLKLVIDDGQEIADRNLNYWIVQKKKMSHLFFVISPISSHL